MYTIASNNTPFTLTLICMWYEEQISPGWNPKVGLYAITHYLIMKHTLR